MLQYEFTFRDIKSQQRPVFGWEGMEKDVRESLHSWSKEDIMADGMLG
mgnify:CR=1 FL=1